MQNELSESIKTKISKEANNPNPRFWGNAYEHDVYAKGYTAAAESILSNPREWNLAGSWVKASEHPLITRDEKGHWTCTEAGDKEFIAAVSYVDKNFPGKTLWWMKHCVIEDETGLCVVGDIDNEPGPWEIDRVTIYELGPAPLCRAFS